MGVWRWADYLEPVPAAMRITLGEGETPLVRSRKIGPSAGFENLLFKVECNNPTGSYKDRFAAVAVSHMVAHGKTRCMAASSGNTGAALSAYCAAAGIRLEIAVVENAPADKLVQMKAYDASVFRLKDLGSDPITDYRLLALLKQRANGPTSAWQISAFRDCPQGMSGLKTIAYELAEQSPNEIDRVFVAAGSGGLTVGVARGFEDLSSAGRLTRRPSVECVQPEGNATIAGPLRRRAGHAEEVTCTTEISGLQVPSIIDGHEACAVVLASGGAGHVVNDEQAWDAQRRLAREEGIFCEPAGAVSLAGALRAREEGLIGSNETIVCVITGSGFKDRKALERMVGDWTCPLVDLDQLS
jgi:threonine synthase